MTTKRKVGRPRLGALGRQSVTIQLPPALVKWIDHLPGRSRSAKIETELLRARNGTQDDQKPTA